MENGIVRAICLATEAGKPMQEVFSVMAIAGQGLEGDRYCTGQGSWSDNTVGKRQVTLINGIFLISLAMIRAVNPGYLLDPEDTNWQV